MDTELLTQSNPAGTAPNASLDAIAAVRDRARTASASAKLRVDEHVRCVSCAEGSLAAHARGSYWLAPDPPRRPFALWRCGDCGLVQQQPRAEERALNLQYGDDYYVFAEDASRRWPRAVQQYVTHLAPFESSRPRRLLDVGCALGHLAALAAARGWTVTALDVSRGATTRAAEMFGLSTLTGALSDHADRPGIRGAFDAVMLGDVIEHVARPVEFLRQVRQVLAPGGVACIDTPNWASPWRRFGGCRWVGFNRFHVNLFDAASLTRALEAAGFTHVRCWCDTNVHYERWSDRPEIRAWLERLPRFIAWRCAAALARMTGRRWDWLRRDPPAQLADALSQVDQAVRASTGRRAMRARRVGDNLCARAWVVV